MSKTGTYKVIDGKVVKISNRIPKTCFDNITCPSSGYYSENLGCFVRSRRHKRDILFREGLRETGDGSVHHTKENPRNAIRNS